MLLLILLLVLLLVLLPMLLLVPLLPVRLLALLPPHLQLSPWQNICANYNNSNNDDDDYSSNDNTLTMTRKSIIMIENIESGPVTSIVSMLLLRIPLSWYGTYHFYYMSP